jgi:hypothetical protein
MKKTCKDFLSKHKQRITICLHSNEANNYLNEKEAKVLFPDLPSDFRKRYRLLIYCPDCGRIRLIKHYGIGD